MRKYLKKVMLAMAMMMMSSTTAYGNTKGKKSVGFKMFRRIQPYFQRS